MLDLQEGFIYHSQQLTLGVLCWSSYIFSIACFTLCKVSKEVEPEAGLLVTNLSVLEPEN